MSVARAAQVALCSFPGMNHLWAGGVNNHFIADASRESAAELACSFWKQYAW